MSILRNQLFVVSSSATCNYSENTSIHGFGICTMFQTLFNKDYTFFSGSVVNNPHSYGVHRFAGAYPPSTYHWRSLGRPTVPFVNHSRALEYYYGNNVVRVW